MKVRRKTKLSSACCLLLSLLLALAFQTFAQSDDSPRGPGQGGSGRGKGDRTAGEKSPRKGGGAKQPIQTSTGSDVPAHPFDLILSRPTTDSGTVSVLCYADTESCLTYGTESGKLANAASVRGLFRPSHRFQSAVGDWIEENHFGFGKGAQLHCAELTPSPVAS